MVGSDINAAQVLDATGQAKNQAGDTLARTRVRGLYVASLASGAIELRDGGATGPLRLKLPVVAEANALEMTLPGNGLLFRSDVHVTLTGVTGVVLFYEG